MADWDKILSRGEVEDRRGAVGLLGGGLGTIVVIGAIIYSLATGQSIDINQILSLLPSDTGSSGLSTSDFEGADQYETFASTVLGSTNDYWTEQFSKNGSQYVAPKLVLFRSATPSACGVSTSEVGPHYCPADQTIYIDETFFDELQSKFGAKGGDVAEAYVIAHEVGHHVQNRTGVMDQVDPSDNEASIAIELQADCYAGAWANRVATAGVFQPGEVNEALDAAAAVGDDRIQSKVTGQISPETWTHGSSEQRVKWFNVGYESGDPSRCTATAA